MVISPTFKPKEESKKWKVFPTTSLKAGTEIADIRITPLLNDLTVTRETLFLKNSGDSAPNTIYLDEIKRLIFKESGKTMTSSASPEVFFAEDFLQWYRERKLDSNYKNLCVSDNELYYLDCTNVKIGIRSGTSYAYYDIDLYNAGSVSYTYSTHSLTTAFFSPSSSLYRPEILSQVYYYPNGGLTESHICRQRMNFNGQTTRTEEEHPEGTCVTEKTYNNYGLLLKTKVTPNASSTPENDVYTEETYTYSDYQLLETHTNAAGQTFTYAKDNFWGRVVYTRMPDRTEIRYSWDSVTGCLEKATIKDSAGNKQEVNLAYTDGYNTETVQNDLRYLSKYANGRISETKYGRTTPYSILKTAEYDDTARTVNQADQNDRRTKIFYDIYGRQTQMNLGSETALTVTYGGTGYGGDNYAESKKINGSSEVLSTTDVYAARNMTFSYKNGIPEETVTSDSDAVQKDTYARDNAYRITTQTMEVDCFSKGVFTEHTDISRQTVEYEDRFYGTEHSSRISKNTHTVEERSEEGTVSRTKTLTTSLSYDTFERVSEIIKETSSAKLVRSMTYDTSGKKDLGRVKIVRQKKEGATADLSAEHYTYDAAGRITQITGIQLSDYTYDGFGRLIRENNRPFGQTITYAYDTYGNITSKKTYAYTTGTLPTTYTEDVFTYGNSDRPDRLTAVNGKTLSYTDNGKDTTHLTSFNGITHTWSKGLYSGYMRQTSSTGERTVYACKYNAQGQRIKTVYDYTPPSTSTLNFLIKREDFMYYHTDGTLQTIVREDTATNGTRRRTHFRFLYGPDGISGCAYKSPENSAPILYTYVKNALGDIIYICDENYNIKAEYVYDAYGNCKIKNDTTGVFASENPFRYRGYFYDVRTKFYYCQTRYYNPAWGRFISMDDVGYVDPQTVSGLNLYAYCNGDPINFSDPTGHIALFILTAILGAAIGLGVTAAIDYIPDKEFNLHWGWYVLGGGVGAAIGAGIGMAISYSATGTLTASLRDIRWSYALKDAVSGNYDKALKLSTKNPKSSAVTLGRFISEDSPNNYVTLAKRGHHTYFNMGKYYDRAGKDLASKINEAFVKKQFELGKKFFCTSLDIAGSYKKEIKLLKELGAHMIWS